MDGADTPESVGAGPGDVMVHPVDGYEDLFVTYIDLDGNYNDMIDTFATPEAAIVAVLREDGMTHVNMDAVRKMLAAGEKGNG